MASIASPISICFAAPPPAYIVSTVAGGLPGGFADGGSAEARFNAPRGVAIDTSGNIYIADYTNHTIRKVTPEGVVTTLAGLAGSSGHADGTGADARFLRPRGVAIDASANIYVVDGGNHTIRKVTPDGVVTTLAGSAGISGSADGTGADARFKTPYGVAIDARGDLFVSDGGNNTIRKVTPEGVVTTLAGFAGSSGGTDGTGAAARFVRADGVAIDASGSIYVADGHTIRKVTPEGVVTTLAGSAAGFGSIDSTGAGARFNTPAGMAVDASGNIFVADSINHTIRKVTPDGVVTTLAGSAGISGSADGTGADARFKTPYGVAIDARGDLLVSDGGNDTLRKVTSDGVVTTLAGTPVGSGSSDSTGATARFNTPYGAAVDGSGHIYVADYNNHTIRKVTPEGVVTTLAGAPGSSGSTDGTGSAARFKTPAGVAVDGSGNIYVADRGNQTIRKVTSDGVVTTLAGSPGSFGTEDGAGAAARFFYPFGLAVDASGNVYVADSGGHTLRKITPQGTVLTLAGWVGFGSSDGTGSAARFNNPNGVAVDASGNIYVADTGNHTIRKVTPDGVVTTLAGSPGSTGSTDGSGGAARFKTPYGLAVDASGNIYVSDTGNNTIRKVAPDGVVTTLAGAAGSNGSADGIGVAARFKTPYGLAVDASSNIYVSDTGHHALRKITYTSSYGHHTADLDRNHRIDLPDLTFAITLYNTHKNNGSGTERTGTYTSTGPEGESFAASYGQIMYVHNADTDMNGRIGLAELTRLIDLYQTSTAGVRTGAYVAQVGTEDGFAPE